MLKLKMNEIYDFDLTKKARGLGVVIKGTNENDGFVYR